MRHGSLFSGIGGFDLAAEWMGWENVFHCEINEFCNKILNHYWPDAKSYTDITKTDFTIHRGKIDILTGGDPCQGNSVIGLGGVNTQLSSCGHILSELQRKYNRLPWLMKMLEGRFQTELLKGKSLILKVSDMKCGLPLLYLQVSPAIIHNGKGYSSLPTPLRDDWKGGTTAIRKDNGNTREDQFRHWWKIRTGCSVPNKTFTGILMGFPKGWTELPYQSTEKKA